MKCYVTQQTVLQSYLVSIMRKVFQRIMKMRWNQDEPAPLLATDFLIQWIIKLFFSREGHRECQPSELVEKSLVIYKKVRKAPHCIYC